MNPENFDTLTLRINNLDYFFPLLKSGSIYSYYKSDISKIERFVRKIFTCFKYPCSFTFSEWKSKVVNAKRVILFDYGYSPLITKYIKKINKYCVVHLYCFNVISDVFGQQIMNDDNIDYIWSFDPGDVQKYGILFNTAMYSLKLFKEPVRSVENSVVFVGGAKNRENDILYIKNLVETHGGKTDFHIIQNPKDYIKYNDYLSLIERSNCILDVTKNGQKGLTLRFMESLFLSKKLITNNIEAKKQNFYNPNNIFVIGSDSIDKLESFFASDYVCIPKEIIEYYDFESWKRRFAEVERV